VELTQEATELFRSNSVASKYLGVATEKLGNEYLEWLLIPFYSELQKRNINLDIITNDFVSVTNTAEQIQKVCELCSLLLDDVICSVEKIPMQIQVICRILNDGVAKKYPESCSKAIGSYFFLRFIVPPLTKNLEPKQQKISVMIAKVIQKLANERLFSTGDPYYVFNVWIKANYSKLLRFYSELIRCENGEDVVLKINPSQRAEYLSYVFDFVSENLEKLKIATASRPISDELLQFMKDIETINSQVNFRKQTTRNMGIHVNKVGVFSSKKNTNNNPTTSNPATNEILI